MDGLALRAMIFARDVHNGQRRKYTDAPYFDHLAEVAGIASTVSCIYREHEKIQAVAWLHDCVEDQDVQPRDLERFFGKNVATGVLLLSDLERGNRAERKSAARKRLAEAPDWVQNIKVADLISNTSSIVMHDPKFAAVYLEEKRLLLDVLTRANPALLNIARGQYGNGIAG